MVTKKDIAVEAAKRLDCSILVSQDMLNVYLGVIQDTLLEWKDINLSWFGKLFIKKCVSRNWVNPKTKEAMVIPAYNTLKFKVSVPFNKEIRSKFPA